ncbi:hypothetical protein HK098_004791 [Nowakowskiella sp. JEL0407]|nr:hypothetical protein HK098_004791 [Nowakowskiella sp. JEL0407]
MIKPRHMLYSPGPRCSHQMWKKLELQEPKPTARSGFQFISHPTSDFIVLYGGYSKQYVKGQKTQGVTHTDMWALKMSTDEKAIKWERRKKGGMTPTIRSGCTMTAFKNRAVLFGGVTDMVEEDDHIQSMCHNDMYIYALETNKWYPFTLRQPKAKKTKAPTPQRKDDFDDAETEDRRNAEDDEDDFGEDLDTVVNSSQMGDFKGKQVEEGEEREVLNAFSPCPRFNAMMAVQKNVLYIFGGIFESADREYTLNDLWALNLDKAQAFECLKADDLRQVGWLGENSDDDDDDDEEDDDDENESDEDSEEEVEDSQTLGSNVVAEQVEEKDDGPIAACPEEEPLVNETLKDYYARTTVYWQRKAMEEGEERNQVGKSLRRDAFQICQDNWSAWQPKLREVAKRMQDDEAGEVTAKKAGSSAESKLRHRG